MTEAFKNIDQVSTNFERGMFDISVETSFIMGNEKYIRSAAQKVNILECLDGKRAMVSYVSETSANKVLFYYLVDEYKRIIQGGALLTTEDLTKEKSPTDIVVTEMNGEKITIRPDQLIGDIALVKFTSLSSPKELQGKTDTGATISSLHADHYKINGNTVTFTCQPLGPNSITVPLKTQHAVKSPDGGTVYRPVIVLNVKVNGKLLNNVEFNLNDRGNMDQPVLIGQNLLQAGKFYVDPSRNEGLTVENIDWERVDNIINETPNSKDPMVIAELYQKMLDSNINFGDLVRFIKSEITKTELDY